MVSPRASATKAKSSSSPSISRRALLNRLNAGSSSEELPESSLSSGESGAESSECASSTFRRLFWSTRFVLCRLFDVSTSFTTKPSSSYSSSFSSADEAESFTESEEGDRARFLEVPADSLSSAAESSAAESSAAESSAAESSGAESSKAESWSRSSTPLSAGGADPGAVTPSPSTSDEAESTNSSPAGVGTGADAGGSAAGAVGAGESAFTTGAGADSPALTFASVVSIVQGPSHTLPSSR